MNVKKLSNQSQTITENQSEPVSTVPVKTTLDSLNICLFSNHESESFEENLKYMEKNYGFFILEEKSCVDKKGLIRFLAKTIQIKHKCLLCTHTFKSGRDCQNHMIDKQHCFMDAEDFDQYDKFYDFTEENRRVAQRIQEKFGHLKARDNEFIYTIEEKKMAAINAQAENDDDSWEDVDSDAEEGEVTENVDEEIEIDESKVNAKKEFYKLRRAKVLSTGELRLPSGKIAGHRDYIRYYKQKLKIEKEEHPHRALMRDRAMQRRFIELQQGLVARAFGTNDATQLMIRNYGNLLGRMKKQIDKLNKRHKRYRKLRWVQLGVSHNKLMHHFKDRNLIINT